ncbi:MAG: EAL domain-containing protein [Planctomycetota bacterium]
MQDHAMFPVQGAAVFQLIQANETVGPLADNTPPPPVLGQATTLRAVSEMLQDDKAHPGVLIRTANGSYIPLYRDRMFLYLAMPYTKDLYDHKPVTEYLKQHHQSEPLTLEPDTPISEAIEKALNRSSETRYDPLLVRSQDGPSPRMVDVRLLLERQRNLLGGALAIVDRQRQEAHVASMHDKLTGLPNREYAMQRLNALGLSCKSDQVCNYGVLFLDFDRFKLINDSLGHDAGDELLVQISQRLKEAVAQSTGKAEGSEQWLTARLGGDEFLVLVNHLEKTEHAEQLAADIIDAMKPHFNLRGYEVSSSPSIGIATCHSSDGSSPLSIVRDADSAMYRAKAQGRARYVLFDQSMQDEALERLYLESQLRKALELDQFRAYYQPIVSCESGETVGFEALARWQHPEMGMISPGKFIPIAEECGAISAIGRFMLEEAVKQLESWNSVSKNSRRLYMSINVSKRQLLQPCFLDHLAEVVASADVEPQQINLEITETVVIDHGDTIVKILQQCKNLGVRLSMDDFGTGLSSLTHLHKYPVDVLKIDQAFVRDLDDQSMYTAVVLAIVTLAKNLGMSIVVEGIERIEQLVQIQALDCDFAQGYLFSQPVPAGQAVQLIERRAANQKRSQVA